MTAMLRPTTVDTLMIRCCEDCATMFAPDTWACTSCGCDELDWVPCSGTGSIVSWTRMHPDAVPPVTLPGCMPHTHDEPATIAIVELDDGPWVYASIEGTLPDRTRSHARVEFRGHRAGGRFPTFSLGRI
ncbi:Zn-ribbon domain-containing OB-fold protein [Rhodococcus sp. NPDC059234]|uniref:Zn-ribbon domain-containing OB-fold protein n=1 Tax=Rhodococcus sp. NPDC059234 TaxID=3346781 RepID=UPI00366DD336